MGIFSSQETQQHDDSPPWYAPSGTYPGTIRRITVGGKSDKGQHAIYSIQASVDKCDGVPNPLDLPMLSRDFDTNIPAQRDMLYALIGRPLLDANGKVAWSHDGLVRWNGYTDENSRIIGDVELTIASEEPRRKQGRNGQPDGWWPIRYKLDDVSRRGEAAERADAAARSLIESAGKPAEPTPPPGPTSRTRR